MSEGTTCCQCGYDLHGLPREGAYPRCPECGAVQTPALIERFRRIRERREWWWALPALAPAAAMIVAFALDLWGGALGMIIAWSWMAVPASAIGIALHCHREGWRTVLSEVVMWMVCFAILNGIVTFLGALTIAIITAIWSAVNA